MERKATREVQIGSVSIGAGNPIAIQTMWDSRLTCIDDTLLLTLNNLKVAGCDIIRFSVLDDADVEMLGKLATGSPMPVVADIHFDYKLALKAIKAGVHKIRINPGNIGAEWKVAEIIAVAAGNGCAIRIGLNGGSLPRKLSLEADRASAMVHEAEDYLRFFEQRNFSRMVFSLKDSDPETTYRACSDFSSRFSYPLHLGVTEAGPLIPSLVKSSVYLGKLLEKGIGDTIRISVTGSLIDEVASARELLSLFNLYKGGKGVSLVSCPRCGRASFDTHWFTQSIDAFLKTVQENISVAVMGCAVNGPGESAHADIGISGVGREVFIYKKGKIVRKTSIDTCIDDFKDELQKVIDEKTDN